MNNITTVVGEDVDLLVILIARALATQEIFLLKPGEKMLKRNYIHLELRSTSSYSRSNFVPSCFLGL